MILTSFAGRRADSVRSTEAWKGTTRIHTASVDYSLIHVYMQVDKLGMAGVNGGKFPAIREHLDKNIGGVYKDMDLTYAVDSSRKICHLDSYIGIVSMNIRKAAKSIPRLASLLCIARAPMNNLLIAMSR